MAISWNPNSTSVKGLEAFLPRQKSYALDSSTKVLGMSFDQSVSQAIGAFQIPVLSLPVRGGTYVVEVYDGEDAVADVSAAVTTLTAYPNEDVSGTGASAWRGSGGTSNIYAYIDEASPSSSDYVKIDSSSGEQTYAFRVNTGSLSLTNKRVVAVRMKCHASNTSLNGTFQMGLDIGGEQYLSGVYSGLRRGFSVSSSYAYEYEWTVNPATGLAWSISDVQAFDTSNELLLVNQIAGIYVMDVQLEVDVQTAAENRLALGVLDDSASGLTAAAWNSVTLTTPTGGTWTKDATGRHLVLLRRTSSSGSLVVPLFDGDGVSWASGWRPTVEAGSLLVTAMGSERTDIFGLIVRTTAPADSVDSIPYAETLEAEVYNGQTAEMEFSDAAAASYGQVRFFAKPNGTEADLTVKVKRRSDNLQYGTTLTFTVDDVVELSNEGSGWKLCDDNLSTLATLTTGTQYYLEFSSTATGTGSDYWSILAYDSWDSGNGVGFGGTTDRATVNGTEADRYDIPATLSVSPATLTGGAVELRTLTLSVGNTGCAVGEIDYVRASWSASALGASFYYYEVQRSEDNQATWATIARIYVESSVYQDDIEGLRGVDASYRVRVRTTTGAASAWLACGTRKPQPRDSEVCFVSNWELSSALTFTHPPGITFTPLDSATIREPYARDGHFAFRGTERRYRSFELPLNVPDTAATDGRGGVAVFDALEDFIVQQIPYVAVLDSRGRRWFADVVVTEERHESAHEIYSQKVLITELTREPVPVQLTAVAA